MTTPKLERIPEYEGKRELRYVEDVGTLLVNGVREPVYRVPTWVHVEDRLPEHGREVLCVACLPEPDDGRKWYSKPHWEGVAHRNARGNWECPGRNPDTPLMYIYYWLDTLGPPREFCDLLITKQWATTGADVKPFLAELNEQFDQGQVRPPNEEYLGTDPTPRYLYGDPGQGRNRPCSDCRQDPCCCHPFRRYIELPHSVDDSPSV